MSIPEPTAPREPAAGDAELSDQTVTSYRGGSVDVDVRLVGRVAVALVLVALTVLAVVLIVAGAHHNDQINRLRQQGVRVTVTVSGCTGLLGGSGSNAAGYACRGSFSLDGQRHDEGIPGSTFRAPGSTLQAVVVPGDPALLSPVAVVDNEHASGTVFILPAVLLVLVLLAVGFLVLRRRHRVAPGRPAAAPRDRGN